MVGVRILGLLAAAAAAPCQQVGQSSWVIRDAVRFEGQPITSISFENAAPGSPGEPLPRAELLSRLPFSAGSIFHEAELRRAIQSLYSTGHFSQVAVDGEQETAGVALRFATTSAYFVGHVAIQGVTVPPNRGQLFGAAKLRLGTLFSEKDTRSAVTSMTELLRENGFYNSHISSHVTYDQDTSQVSVRFEINAGKRARFEQPEITGSPDRSVEAIVRATHWQRLYGLLGWQQVTQARVQAGLNNLRSYYDKHNLLQSRVTLAREYNPQKNTVRPVIHIEAGTQTRVHVSGVSLNTAELRSLVPIFQERSVDRDLLDEGQQKLEAFLQADGYFGAEAPYSTTTDAGGRITSVTYNVTRGQRHRFVYLSVSGNRYFTSQTLRERLAEIPAQWPRYPHGRFSPAYVQQDVATIEQMYMANGFAQVKVGSRTVDDFGGIRGHLGVYLTIHEGEQTLISNLTVEGATDRDQRGLQYLLTSTEGQPFSSTNVALDRENILNYYYDLGYIGAAFDYSVENEPNTHQVRLMYTVTPGPRKYVRDVLVSGLQTTRPGLVLNRIELKQAEPLSLTKETDSQRRLYDLGVFARVNAAMQNPDGDEMFKNVLYDIDEASHYSLNVGVGAQIARIGGGVTTLDNPAGTTGFAPRLALGITRENFLGLGQSLGLQSSVSTIEQRLALTWFIPQFVSNPNLNLTTVFLVDNSNDIRTFSATRREASLQLGERVSRAYTFQYRLVFRNVSIGNLKIDPLLVPLLSQPETETLTEVSLIEDRRDDPTDAHRGVYNTVNLSYAPGFLGSQTQFGRAVFRNSTYHQLHRDFVLARSTQIGVISRTGGRPGIPLAERFYSGGSTSIRAFPDFQAGPRDTITGFPIGGNALFINNTELRFPLYGDNLGAVIFHDAGNVYSSPYDFSPRFRQDNLQDFNYMVQDVGVGIRYRTPIGPIRADFSFSPDAPRFFGLKGTLQDYLSGSAVSTVQKINAFQFHISLGQAF